MLVDPALVAPVLGGVDRDDERARGSAWPGGRPRSPRASRGRAPRRSRSGRPPPPPRRACRRSCARSRPRTRRGRAGARARARGGSITPPDSSSGGSSSRPRASTCTSTSWRGEVLGQLAHVARQPALDQRRVLPGQDQDAHQGVVREARSRSGARLRSVGPARAAESARAASAASRARACALEPLAEGSRRPARGVAMNAQSLAWRASSSRAARSSAARGSAPAAAAATVRSSAARAAKASSATAGASQVERSFPLPQVEAASAPLDRLHQLDALRDRDEPQPAARAPRRARRAATPAPRTTSGRAARCRARSRAARRRASVEPRARALDEVARVLARERERGRVVVGAAAVGPRLEVVDGAAVVVAVGAVGGVAGRVVPDELDRRPVDRHGHRAGIGARGPQVVEAGHRASGRRRRRARHGRPARARGRARRRTRAARSRRPNRRSGAGGRRCRWRAGAACPASVASRGSSACVAAEVQSSTPSRRAEGPEQVAAALLEALGRAPRSRPPRGAPRPRARARPRARGPPRPRRGPARGSRAGSAGSARPPSPRIASSWSHSTGVRPTRHGRAVEQVEQRQVDAGHRLPEPLLAERPGAEALHVGHVRVEHERERAPAARRSCGHRARGAVRAERAARARRRRSWRAPTRIAGQRGDPERGDGVEGGMDGDHREQRAGALVDAGRARCRTPRSRGGSPRCPVPWKCSAPNTSTVDQRRGPHAQLGAQRPVEEAAEEDLLGHRRDHDHGERHEKGGERARAADLLDVRSRPRRAARCSRARTRAAARKPSVAQPTVRPQPRGPQAEVPGARRARESRRTGARRPRARRPGRASSTSSASAASVSEIGQKRSAATAARSPTVIATKAATSATGAYHTGQGGRAAAGSSGGSAAARRLKAGAPRRSRAPARAGPGAARSRGRRWPA